MAPKYTVTFHTYNSTTSTIYDSTATIAVESGDTIFNVLGGQPNQGAKPPIAIEQGQGFRGWYRDEDGNNKFDVTDHVGGNMNLYACWGYLVGETRAYTGGGRIFYRKTSGFTIKSYETVIVERTAYYLEAYSADLSTALWSLNTNPTGATDTDIGAGNKNTAMILDKQGGSGYAAFNCENIAGYWHLPSWDELTELYNNKDKVGGFTSEWYWSSSESSINTANAQIRNFINGSTYQQPKRTVSEGVRPIRAF